MQQLPGDELLLLLNSPRGESNPFFCSYTSERPKHHKEFTSKKSKDEKKPPKIEGDMESDTQQSQDQHRILGLINQKMNKIDQNSSQTSQIPTAKATLFLQFYKIFNKIPTFFGDQSCESFSRYKTTQAGFLERLRLAQDVLSQQQEECSIKVLVWEEKR